MTESTLGLYLHIPFCLGKCAYCDFHSGKASAATRAAYVAALCRQLEKNAPRAAAYTVDTVYIGGGTPTVLCAEPLSLILDAVAAHYRLAADAEITVECNPATGDKALFDMLVAKGVNRLSIGLQSIHEAELHALGRLHDFADFCTTYETARRAGISNINVDLMLGIPHQTLSSLGATLDAVLALFPDHLSAYGLRLEEGTPLYERREVLTLPDDDTVADMQELTARRLAGAGFLHYEVSNYARNRRFSRHNLRYWRSLPYLGFGAGAHSYFEGVRFFTPPDNASYLAAVAADDRAALECEPHTIEGEELRDEYVMLRMRLFEGIDEAEFKARFGASFEEVYGSLSRLEKGGLLRREGGRIAFTERGMYVSNTILADWLSFGEA